MKQNISNILVLTFLLLGMSACKSEKITNIIGDDNGNASLAFSFNTRADATSEDEIDSDLDLNEDKIETLDLFFFENPTDDGIYTVHYQRTNNNTNKNTTYTVQVPSNGLDMTGNTQYLIYAVVNRVIEVEKTPSYTLASLKAMAANKEITTGDKAIQTYFVMDGELQTTLSSTMQTPVIPLKRSAAKITLDINVADEIFVGSSNTKYTPIPNTMTVSMINGVKNGIINGVDTPDFFATDSKSNPTTRTIEEITEGNDHIPFYSYPYQWDADGNNDCHLYLTIDWQSELGGLSTYYYIVPIGEVTELVRNNHYKIDLDVAILGGTEEEPVTLNSNYIIENWSTQTISTELKKYRFLWVENTSYEMKNTTELRIPYASSHNCERIVVTCKQPNLATNVDKTWDDDDFSSTNPNAEFYCALVDGEIVYKHPLENDYKKDDFDFTPYDIEIKIQHIDNEDGIANEMSKTIKIKQYPAIYAEAKANSDYNDGSSNRNDTNDNRGYMFVNGYTEDGEDITTQDYFCSANGMANVDFENPTYNMFVITVTSVDQTEYLLGDPREKEPLQSFIDEKHNGSYSIWAAAPSTDGSASRILKNYLATEVNNSLYANNNNTVYENDKAAEAGERTVKMLAPKFRVASAYAVLGTGATEAQYLHYMKKRCASYQEDGYPAGRWRLPTRAEFQFIVYLSYKEKIPTLYDPTSNYWCAHGYGKPNNGNVTMNYETKSGGNSVRCVYDEWYWGSEKIADKTKFTWGDEPITQK